MSTITLRFQLIPEKRQEFIQTIRLVSEKIRQEKGLVEIRLFQDVDNDSHFNIVEEWKTQEYLDSHIRSENFRVLIGALKVLSEHTEIRYDLKAGRSEKTKILKI